MDQYKKKMLTRYIPDTIKNQDRWQRSRRTFVKTILLAGISTQLPLLQSCYNNSIETEAILPKNSLIILRIVQDILFPSDYLGPGALELKADKYLLWVLSDKRLDKDEQQYIRDGIAWVEETAQETYEENFTSLTRKKQELLIANISKENWGENWLSVLLTFIFEAMFADPLYGSNPDGIGWKWLEHNPGNPRPTAQLMYDNILSNL